MPVLNQEILINPELSHACINITLARGGQIWYADLLVNEKTSTTCSMIK